MGKTNKKAILSMLISSVLISLTAIVFMEVEPLFVCIGLMLLLIIRFSSPNFFVDSTYVWLGAFVILASYAVISNNVYNDFVKIGFLHFNLNYMTSTLFLPMTYLMVKYKNYSSMHLVRVLYIAALPCILLILLGMVQGIILLLTVMVFLVVKASHEKRIRTSSLILLGLSLAMGMGLIIFIISSSTERFERLLKPDGALLEAFTKGLEAKEILFSASLFKGVEFDSEIFGVGWEFVELVAGHGWWIGIIFLALQILLVSSLYKMSLNIKHSYANYFTYAIFAFFLTRIVLSLLSVLGIIPFVDFSFAFTGYSSSILIDFLLVGIAFNFYVNRNHITSKVQLDVDYDTTYGILDVYRDEVKERYKDAKDDERVFLEKIMEDIEKDDDDWKHNRTSHLDMTRRFAQYEKAVERKVAKDTVFISYNQRDVAIAKYLCQKIEAKGHKCWYFTRDCKIGEYAEKIVKALRRTKVFVVVVSNNSNNSKHVLNEVSIAFEQIDNGTIMMPVKIEDIEFSDNMKYYLCRQEWVLALNRDELDKFSRNVSRIMGVTLE